MPLRWSEWYQPADQSLDYSVDMGWNQDDALLRKPAGVGDPTITDGEEKATVADMAGATAEGRTLWLSPGTPGGIMWESNFACWPSDNYTSTAFPNYEVSYLQRWADVSPADLADADALRTAHEDALDQLRAQYPTGTIWARETEDGPYGTGVSHDPSYEGTVYGSWTNRQLSFDVEQVAGSGFNNREDAIENPETAYGVSLGTTELRMLHKRYFDWQYHYSLLDPLADTREEAEDLARFRLWDLHGNYTDNPGIWEQSGAGSFVVPLDDWWDEDHTAMWETVYAGGPLEVRKAHVIVGPGFFGDLVNMVPEWEWSVQELNRQWDVRVDGSVRWQATWTPPQFRFLIDAPAVQQSSIQRVFPRGDRGRIGPTRTNQSSARLIGGHR
jgi:hypothetical protein